jgi:hypothetical protein
MAASWESVVSTLMRDLDKTVAGRYSAVLYGSAARGDWVPGISDVNLLLVLDDTSPAALRGLAPALADWRGTGNAPPLVLSRTEWAGAADAFPIEVTDIMHAHRLLAGSDPIAGMRVDPADLRLMLEHEFLGKLLQLRRGYVALAGDPAALTHLGTASVPTILILQRALLSLVGKTVPREVAPLVRDAAALVGADADAQIEFVKHRPDAAWVATREQFEAYLAAVESAARYLNQLQIGARS